VISKKGSIYIGSPQNNTVHRRFLSEAVNFQISAQHFEDIQSQK